MKKTKTSSAKKKDPDRIELLVKEHLANTAAAEDTFRIALALLEKHKAKYAELEQYAEKVSPTDRTISVLDNVEGSKRAHHIFKIVVAGVEVSIPGQIVILYDAFAWLARVNLLRSARGWIVVLF